MDFAEIMKTCFFVVERSCSSYDLLTLWSTFNNFMTPSFPKASCVLFVNSSERIATFLNIAPRASEKNCPLVPVQMLYMNTWTKHCGFFTSMISRGDLPAAELLDKTRCRDLLFASSSSNCSTLPVSQTLQAHGKNTNTWQTYLPSNCRPSLLAASFGNSLAKRNTFSRMHGVTL